MSHDATHTHPSDHAMNPLETHVMMVMMGMWWLLLFCRYLYEVAPTNRRCLVVAFGWSGVVSIAQ
jgi:hypothetical protein